MATGSRSARSLEPYTGLAYVVCFVGSVVASAPPKDNAPDAAWIANYSTHGRQLGHLVTGVLLLLAGLSLMSFLVVLWRRIAAATTSGSLSPLPLAAAATAAACMGVGGMVMAYISGGQLLGSYPLPGADLLRMSNDLGFALAGIAGAWSAALAVAALSVQAHRVGLFSSRMRNAGIVVACVLTLSVLFVPIVALLAWVLVASVKLIRSSRPSIALDV